jgi:metacaspase-1
MAKGISIHIGLNKVDPNHYQDEHGKPWDGALTACEFDAKDMQALAASQGFTPQTFLTEQATTQNVIDAITSAAQQLKSGDILFLSYSGHGGQVPDRNDEEEEDQMDETWCLFDRQLIDDELYALWGKFARGVRIFMLSDSCHSGSVARDPELQQITAAHGKARVLPAEVQAATYRSHKSFYDGLQTANPSGDRVDIDASVILISGCQDNQTSADGARNGLFTEMLLKVWSGGKFKGNLLHFQRRISACMPWYQSPNYFRTGTPSRQFESQRPFTI